MKKTKDMKILHINFQDCDGAGKAALRLHLGLKSFGLESKMLVIKRATEAGDIVILPRPISRRIANKVHNRLSPLKTKGRDIFTNDCSGYDLSRHPLVKEADIIILGWIAFMINYTAFFPNVLDKQIIWRLADMNPFTGGCHYAEGCTGYETGCGACPQLGSKDPKDLSRKIWERKEKAYRGHNIHIVVPSRWLANCARKSRLFREFKISIIPYGVPTSVFIKHHKQCSRELLGLPEDKILILFGAAYQTERKGARYLAQALRLLKNKIDNSNLALVVFGACPVRLVKEVGFSVYNLGYIKDESRLSYCYSAADIFVIPSLEEAFGQTCLESMACGTPVIGFNSGGIPDMIRPEITGLLAEVENTEELTEKIEWMISHPDERQQMGENTRKLAGQEYTLEIEAKRYLNLYKSLLSDNEST